MGHPIQKARGQFPSTGSILAMMKICRWFARRVNLCNGSAINASQIRTARGEAWVDTGRHHPL